MVTIPRYCVCTYFSFYRKMGVQTRESDLPMGILHKNHTNLTLHLRSHTIYQLSHVEPGTTVVCEKGVLLVTQAGNPQDYTLRSGRQMVLGGHGNVLIEAMDDCGLSILYPN